MNATAEVVLLTTYVPVALHKRAKTISRRHRTSMAHLVRVSLEERLDQIEIKEQDEKAQKAQDRAPKRKASEITPLDQRPAVEIVSSPVIDRLAVTFEDHAARIAAVYNSPAELAIRRDEALKAIRRLAPLTYRDDLAIERRLEALIADKALADEPAPLIVQSMMTQPKPVEEPSQALGKMFAAFKQIMAPAAAEPDPLIGKSLDLASIKRQSVLSDDSDVE